MAESLFLCYHTVSGYMCHGERIATALKIIREKRKSPGGLKFSREWGLSQVP